MKAVLCLVFLVLAGIAARLHTSVVEEKDGVISDLRRQIGGLELELLEFRKERQLASGRVAIREGIARSEILAGTAAPIDDKASSPGNDFAPLWPLPGSADEIDKAFQAMALSEKLSKIPPDVMGVFLPSQYRNEETDREWAAGQASGLQSLLASNQYLSSYPADDVECKSTQCRISMVIAEEEKVRYIDALYAELIRQGYFTESHALLPQSNSRTGQLEIYFVRMDALLERAPEL